MGSLEIFDWTRVFLAGDYSEMIPPDKRLDLLSELLKPHSVSIDAAEDKVIIEGPWGHICNANVALTDFFSSLQKNTEEALTSNKILTDDNSEYNKGALCYHSADILKKTYAETCPQDNECIPLKKYIRDFTERGLNDKICESEILRVHDTIEKLFITDKTNVSQESTNDEQLAGDDKALPIILKDDEDLYIDITLSSQVHEISELYEGGASLPLIYPSIDDNLINYLDNDNGNGDRFESIQESVNNSRETGYCTENQANQSRKLAKKLAKKEYEDQTPFKFFCSECSFKTKRESHYRLHRKRHENNCQLFRCQDCDFVTIGQFVLKRHCIDNHNLGSIECDLCTFRTDKMRLLATHKRTKHAIKKGITINNIGAAIDQQGSEMLQCTECDYSSNKPHLMQRHNLAHGRAKQRKRRRVNIFKCEHCAYTTKVNKYRLLNHIRSVHDTKKNHLCDACGKSYKRLDGLKQHVLTHRDINEQFKCPICGKFRNSRAKLEFHLNTTHSKTRAYLCEICGAAFKTLPNQRKHMLTLHENPRAFSCDECSRKFNTQFTLKRHMKMHKLEKYLPVSSTVESVTVKSNEATQIPIRLVIQDASQVQSTNIITDSQLVERSVTVVGDADSAFCLGQREPTLVYSFTDVIMLP